ncbi:MAG: hypothetical protein LBN37_03000, partial [Bacteroidales bacterium]|nr:hypothetical protein [Bacteroidales bacterium]
DATKIVRHEIQKLVPGVIYNIPANVWHNIAMQEDARIIIVEDADTHLHDVTYQALSKEQQKELYEQIKTYKIG